GAQPGDVPGRDRREAALAAGVADRDDLLAHADAGRRADGGRLEPRGALELQHRDVMGGVVADHLGLVGLAVAHVGDPDGGGTVDDVVVGQYLAVGGQHDAGTRRLGSLVAQRGHHVDHRRVGLLHDGRGAQRLVAQRPADRGAGHAHRPGGRAGAAGEGDPDGHDPGHHPPRLARPGLAAWDAVGLAVTRADIAGPAGLTRHAVAAVAAVSPGFAGQAVAADVRGVPAGRCVPGLAVTAWMTGLARVTGVTAGLSVRDRRPRLARLSVLAGLAGLARISGGRAGLAVVSARVVRHAGSGRVSRAGRRRL